MSSNTRCANTQFRSKQKQKFAKKYIFQQPESRIALQQNLRFRHTHTHKNCLPDNVIINALTNNGNRK